ncbi:Aste57867_22190 [Aphanomyces stellatus]|uniref:Aste57867_22190 protein n=1 Tax=Aphanomyces stellatus TaxID=120398 RepID=A0A485LLH6_9STRA|nr:hypothetical protein As57867_022121 [Aphanomyces stellatus]VFT98857.1 Aste57867_22190 [Aphanomyces stellatus]
MDCNALTTAFVTLCTNVVFVYRWVMGGMCSPVDIGTDRSSTELWQSSRKRSMMTMTDFDHVSVQCTDEVLSHDRRLLVDQGVLATPYDINLATKEEKGKTKTKQPRMPMLQTAERGLKYQHKLQEKIKEWQTLAAKQRVFKATPLPPQYKLVPRKATRSIEDEKEAIEMEKKQLSIDMLHLLNAMATRNKIRAADSHVVPLERS